MRAALHSGQASPGLAIIENKKLLAGTGGICCICWKCSPKARGPCRLRILSTDTGCRREKYFVSPAAQFLSGYSTVVAADACLGSAGGAGVACGRVGLEYVAIVGLVPFACGVVGGIFSPAHAPAAQGCRLVPRPFPPWTLRFWLAVFAALNLPKGALIRLNNLVTGNMTVRREEAHILVARCLQRSQCSHPVTADISHCRECGRCKIGAVKAIATGPWVFPAP